MEPNVTIHRVIPTATQTITTLINAAVLSNNRKTGNWIAQPTRFGTNKKRQHGTRLAPGLAHLGREPQSAEGSFTIFLPTDTRSAQVAREITTAAL